MTEKDTDDWVDALAGREPGAADRAAVLEARALRAALRARAIEPVAEVPAKDAAREAQLLERAGRAGLLPRTRIVASRRPWLAFAASIALVGLGLVWLQRPAVIEPIVRSAPDAVYRVSVADPSAAKRDLMAALAAVGVEARGYERLGVPGVDADLPQPLTVPVREVLRRFVIPEPRDGVLRVEFEGPPTP